MNNNGHIRFLGIMVFVFAIFTGIALMLNNNYSLPSLFGGILLISYTLLQLVVGLKRKDNEDDEGEDF